MGMALKPSELTDEIVALIIKDSNFGEGYEIEKAIDDEEIFVYTSREDYLADGWEFDSRQYYGAFDNGVTVRYVHG